MVKYVGPTHMIDARGWVEAVVTPTPALVHALMYRNANANVELEVRGVVMEEARGESPCPKATATEPARREVVEREEEGRAKREHVRQSASWKRRF